MNRRSFIKTVFGGLAGVFLCGLTPAEETAEIETKQLDELITKWRADLRLRKKQQAEDEECNCLETLECDCGENDGKGGMGRQCYCADKLPRPPEERCTCDACNQPALTFGIAPMGIRPCERIMERYRNRP